RECCRGQYDRRHVFEQLVLQQTGDVDGRRAQKDSAIAALQPVDKLLVRAGDDKLESETYLAQPPNQTLDVCLFVFHCVERALDGRDRLVDEQVEFTELGWFDFAAGVLAREGSRNDRIAAVFAAAFAKAHPEIVGKARETGRAFG